MKEKSTRIVVEFKKDSTDPYAAQGQPTDPNLLIIHVNPDEKVTLRLNSRDPLNAGQLETVLMNYHSEAKDVPEAYERLIFDALRGDSTFLLIGTKLSFHGCGFNLYWKLLLVVRFHYTRMQQALTVQKLQIKC